MSRIKGKATTNQTPSETVVVGVDVSKTWLDVFLHPMGERLRVENDAAGIGKLLTSCLAHSAGLVVMEATGRYHRAAHNALHDAGIRLRLSTLIAPGDSRMCLAASPRRTRSTPKSWPGSRPS